MAADPTCKLCAGTGVIPPFMDECSCATTAAPAAPKPLWLPASPAVGTTTSLTDTGETVVWTGTEWAPIKTEALTPAEYHAKYGAAETPAEPPSDPYAAIASELTALGVGEVVVGSLGHAADRAADVIDELVDPHAGMVDDLVTAAAESHAAVTAWAKPAVSEKLMTLAQATLMKRLVAERDKAHGTVRSATLALSGAVTCSASMASKLIDDLMLIPRTVAVPRPNKFSGTCQVCRGPVAAGAGQIIKVDGKWRTQHLDGGCLSAEDTAKREADQVTEPGLYKLQEITGEGVTTFVFRVRKSRTSKRLYAERVIVDPESKAVRFAYHGKAIHMLSKHDRLTWAEARDFGAAYGSCVACGRTLSDARSLVQGYGATCAGHYMWPTVTNKTAEAIIAGALTWEDAIAAKGFV